MLQIGPELRALVDAFDEPTPLVEGRYVRLADEPAKALLGRGIEGRDVRLAIRHPQALENILAVRSGEIDAAPQA